MNELTEEKSLSTFQISPSLILLKHGNITGMSSELKIADMCPEKAF